MQCQACGQTIDSGYEFCPHCGTAASPEAKVTAAPDEKAEATEGSQEAEQQRLQAQRMAYVRGDYDPCRDGRPTLQPAAAQGAQQPAAEGPSTSGMIVFSIINIVFCGLGISLILGVIALVFAIMAGSEPDVEAAKKKIGLARILNLVGLGFIILQVILIFLTVMLVLFFSVAAYGPAVVMAG